MLAAESSVKGVERNCSQLCSFGLTHFRFNSTPCSQMIHVAFAEEAAALNPFSGWAVNDCRLLNSGSNNCKQLNRGSSRIKAMKGVIRMLIT